MKRFLSLFLCVLFLVPVNAWAYEAPDYLNKTHFKASENADINGQKVPLALKFALQAHNKYGRKPFSQVALPVKSDTLVSRYDDNRAKLKAASPTLFPTKSQQNFTRQVLDLLALKLTTSDAPDVKSWVGNGYVDLRRELVGVDLSLVCVPGLSGEQEASPDDLFALATWHELGHAVFFVAHGMHEAKEDGKRHLLVTNAGLNLVVPRATTTLFETMIDVGTAVLRDVGVNVDSLPYAMREAMINEIFADAIAIAQAVRDGQTVEDAFGHLVILTYYPSPTAAATDDVEDPHLRGRFRAEAVYLFIQRMKAAGIEFFNVEL